MNIFRVMEILQHRYPMANTADLVRIPPDNPKELILEIARERIRGQSTAVAVIDQSEPLYHVKTVEVYQVTHGRLTMHIDNHIVQLQAGQVLIVQPLQVHWARGNQTWVKVHSSPAWTQDDHILVPKYGQAKL